MTVATQMFAEAELGAGALEGTRPVIESQRVVESPCRGVVVLRDQRSAAPGSTDGPRDLRRLRLALESCHNGLGLVGPPQPHIRLDEVGMDSKMVRIPDSTVLERGDAARELLRRGRRVTAEQRERAERVSGLRRVPGITEVKRRLQRAPGVPAAVFFSPERCLECRQATGTLIAALRCSHLLDDCYCLEGVRVRAPQIAAVPLQLRVHMEGVI